MRGSICASLSTLPMRTIPWHACIQQALVRVRGGTERDFRQLDHPGTKARCSHEPTAYKEEILGCIVGLLDAVCTQHTVGLNLSGPISKPHARSAPSWNRGVPTPTGSELARKRHKCSTKHRCRLVHTHMRTQSHVPAWAGPFSFQRRNL
jgi:hypothetical protein